MNFAREGYPFIGIALVATIALYSGALLRRSWPLWIVAFVFTLLTLWVAYFFRDPERSGERGADVVIAPADGRIIDISEVDEPTFMRAKVRRISIFMNVFNVHVNRYPVDGVVRYVHRNPGKFLNAADDKASLENEQNSVGLESKHGKVLMRQIAGLIARRIVTYSKDGDAATQGQRMGIIRFGSRVDLFLPLSARIEVTLGQHTVAGTTVMARQAEQ